MGAIWRITGLVLLALVALTLLAQSPGLYSLLGISAITGLLLLVVLGVWLGLMLLAFLQPGVRAGLLLLAVPLVPVAFVPPMLALMYALLLLGSGFLTAGVVRLKAGKNWSGAAFAVAGGLPLLLGISAFLLPGWSVEETASWAPVSAELLEVPDPGAPGEHPVLSFHYGSGVDRHRPEFGAEANWITESVDASALVDGWDGLAGWSRTRYWGFDVSALPVQGRVWVPDAPGPHPLVLIVHGNHEMTDFSDGGYAYLGEQLASRGFATVSVDENFLNSGMADLLGGPDGGLEEESDARGWLLLEHLTQWREWTQDPDHPMYDRVDLDRVALIGHSRGGEAISEAAHFNRLPRYPDDGTLAFDFEFGIRGIIAIAPVDQQYHPRGRDTVLEDLSLLVIHGSHDSDVDAFVGTAMYSRLRFLDCAACFKTSFYLVGANHGQFNTVWGRYDTSFPAARMLNVVPLMDAGDQRQVARVLFSAFLEVVLNGREEYRRFLALPESGRHWFPDGTSWLSSYGDASQISLIDFEADANLASGAPPVAEITATGMSIWREREVPLRWQTHDSAAVLLGWGGDLLADTPVFEIQLVDGGLAVSPDMALTFAAALGTDAPPDVEDFAVPDSLDFEIELIDLAGESARVRLSERRPLYPQVNPVLYKLDALDASDASEVVFQRYLFSFADWLAVNPSLDLTRLNAVRFRFPGSKPASVWLDDIAISQHGY